MILERLETYFTAATYAQCGEHQTALGFMNTKTTLKENKGELRMNQVSVKQNSRKYVMPSILYGAVSLSLYAALLMNEGKITDVFTRGGWYTVLPVGCAFLFSFIHGAFASNLLSALGLEAKK
jgi:hypothetical protein